MTLGRAPTSGYPFTNGRFVNWMLILLESFSGSETPRVELAKASQQIYDNHHHIFIGASVWWRRPEIPTNLYVMRKLLDVLLRAFQRVVPGSYKGSKLDQFDEESQQVVVANRFRSGL